MSVLIDVFQLASLALFLGLVSERTLHILVRQGINPIRLSIRRNEIRHSVTVTLFLGVLFWAGYVLRAALHLSLLPSALDTVLLAAPVAQGLGVALIIAAFVVFVLALVGLGNSWRLGIDEKRPGALVTTGIYALSRNPIYVFFDLYFIGTFLINGTLAFALFALLVALNLHGQILQEEKFLAHAHGPAYAAYCARTARYWRLR